MTEQRGALLKRTRIKVQGGKMYIPVSTRITMMREDHPNWGIITEIVEINHEAQSPYAIFRATIFNEEGRALATATKKEDVRGFADYIEKSETGSVGRALAMCGYADPEYLDTALDGGDDGSIKQGTESMRVVDTPRKVAEAPTEAPKRRERPTTEPVKPVAARQELVPQKFKLPPAVIAVDEDRIARHIESQPEESRATLNKYYDGIKFEIVERSGLGKEDFIQNVASILKFEKAGVWATVFILFNEACLGMEKNEMLDSIKIIIGYNLDEASAALQWEAFRGTSKDATVPNYTPEQYIEVVYELIQHHLDMLEAQ
jgi:hypothetical protein